jgi:hypothetical protein
MSTVSSHGGAATDRKTSAGDAVGRASDPPRARTHQPAIRSRRAHFSMRARLRLASAGAGQTRWLGFASRSARPARAHRYCEIEGRAR